MFQPLSSFIRVVQTLGYLLRKELPYYCLLPKEPYGRCGFNKLEKWIYENSEKFGNSKIEKYIEEEIESRNNLVDENQKVFNSNKQYQKDYEYFKSIGQLAIFQLMYKNRELPFKLSELDKEIYNNYGDLKYFIKLDKKNTNN